MKEQFADYETSKKLKALGFNEKCFGYFSNLDHSLCQGHFGDPLNETILIAPTWQQTEEWLWEKHKIHVQVFKVHGSELFNFENRNTSFLDYPRYGGGFQSPVTAHIEGIKKAIEYLHSQTAVAVTPINTSANGA